jgi:hypothetical protein
MEKTSSIVGTIVVFGLAIYGAVDLGYKILTMSRKLSEYDV